jgi:Domain of unknown function (DUF4440)
VSEAADVLRAVERERLRALVEVDMTLAQLVHAEDFVLVTPRGGTLSKYDYLGLVSSGSLDYRRFEPVSDIDVLLDGDVAALRYRSWIENVSGGRVFASQCWHTDCYRYADDRWQVVFSQATAIDEEG